MRLSSKNTKIIGFCLAIFAALAAFTQPAAKPEIKTFTSVTCGNQRLDVLLPLLKKKRVALITNVTGVLPVKAGDEWRWVNLADTLLKCGVKLKKIFGPEHGFRSDTEAGEKVSSGVDAKTGLPVISLYGSNKKPAKEQLSDVDVVVYDIQDVGVRFYTYISTMCYAMEACAENKKEMIVLDRPNPNGFYIDGPVMKKEWKGFLGLHPVPLVYGMTCGEYAKMANGEGWLKNKAKCRLTVITMKDYERKCSYELPVRPSPNLPNPAAVLLYPSLGLFEGSIMSLGRGTDFPFQVVGHPSWPDSSFCFEPKATTVSRTPKYLNQKCCGVDLRTDAYLTQHPRQINLSWLRLAAMRMRGTEFFDKNFNYHAGNAELQQQIVSRISLIEIRNSWKAEMDAFRLIRKKYLLYADME